MSMNYSVHLDWRVRKLVPLLHPVNCNDLAHLSTLAVAVDSLVNHMNQSTAAAAVAVAAAVAAVSMQMLDYCHP